MNIVDPSNNGLILNDIPSPVSANDFSFKSPLMDWLRINSPELDQAFLGLKRRNWEAVAVQATAAGVRNGHDLPVTKGCCRQAWYRLKKSAATAAAPKDVARGYGDKAASPRRSAQGSQVFNSHDASEPMSPEIWSSFAGDELDRQNNLCTEKKIQPGRKKKSDDV